MRTLFIFLTIISSQVWAKPTECPEYKNKRECLLAATENYQDLLDFINENYEEDSPKKTELIEASLDTKKYESLACQKTCFN